MSEESQNGDNLPVALIGDVPGITLNVITVARIKDFNDVASQLVQLLAEKGRGRAQKSKDCKPEFLEGSAAKPAVFEPEKIANELKVWWEDGSGDKFLIEQGTDENPIWRTYNETKLVKLLRCARGRNVERDRPGIAAHHEAQVC